VGLTFWWLKAVNQSGSIIEPNSKPKRVICRRTVTRGHRLVVQSQVHAELSAVMHQVIQKHLTVSQES
jgi:hypothetical protein